MLRSAVARAGAQRATFLRSFSRSAPVCAVAPPPKKQSKVTRKKEVKEKVKKGGMTHLKFGEAVRHLKYENLAADLTGLGLAELSASDLQSISSNVVIYNNHAEKTLKELGAFKKNQNHELFSRPVSMVTENTSKIHSEFIEKLASESAQNRLCLLGEKGAGKSTLVAQTQALLLSHYKGDVVLLHVDQAEKVVDGSSDYFYNPSLKKFHQPMFTKRWIKKVRAANEAVFKKMPLTEDVSFVSKKEKHSLKKEKHTIYDFLTLNHEFGFYGPSNAFQFFVKQLQAHSNKFPVLVSIDNFNALIRDPHTAYFHTDMRPVTLGDLEFGSFISLLVSGDLSFAKGGVMLSESKDLGECKTLRAGLRLEQPNPYEPAEKCDLDFAKQMTKNGGVKTFQVENLTKEQARGLLLFLDKVGVLQIREYPTKEIYKSLEESAFAPGTTINVGEYVRCQDREAQFERILQLTYFASAGNPGRFLKINSLTF
ncbi:small subunit ribosomal protein S29 [Metschnikowia aff. pulcherrima]|uniref:Small ribosomal subunit protein mS29 n=1 Tax=Metschnikowia aff. pulcherrima TaxID=2163413 RepID=A0A4P6XK69_9ASCO|nr:small subunit ribosomal protein S29 [Metschnikowia aff. pulcherrima]